VDIKKFYPSKQLKQKMREQMGIPASDIVIIVAARLSQEKRIDRAIDAFDELCLKHPHTHLVIAGTGPYEERLKTLAAGKSFKDKIKFLGQASNVDELYQMSDVYVLSSDNEGLSLAFLEALASGLVCVVTRCTGTAEVIQNATNGFLVEKSMEGVLNGLQNVLGLSEWEREIISRNAVDCIADRFEIRRNVGQALAILGMPAR